MTFGTFYFGRALKWLVPAIFVASTVTYASALSLPMLVQVQVRPGPGSTRLVLRFSPTVPLYQISRPNPHSYTLSFQNVVQSAGVPQVVPTAGFIAPITVKRSGEMLLFHFETAQDSTLNITRLSTELDIDVTPNGTVPTANVAPPPNQSISGSALGETTIVVPLKFARLTEAAEILTGQALAAPQPQTPIPSILGQTLSEGTSGGIATPGGSYGTMTVSQFDAPRASERVTDSVSIDWRLHALVLHGSETQIGEMLATIRNLDVPGVSTPSVELDTEIVELTDTAAKNIGFELNTESAAAQASVLAQTFNLPISEVTLQAQLFAQIQRGNGRLLAKPRLQTLSGTSASILTGDALPIITTITYPGSPPTVQQQVQYVNVGVHLQVKPYVSGSGYVTSRILVEVSNVTGYIAGNIPQISERQAVATARVKSGRPFVVGGLLQDNEIRSMSKIPVLGDLPIIGPLFRSVHSTMEKTNLYVIVTPRIIRQ